MVVVILTFLRLNEKRLQRHNIGLFQYANTPPPQPQPQHHPHHPLHLVRHHRHHRQDHHRRHRRHHRHCHHINTCWKNREKDNDGIRTQ